MTVGHASIGAAGAPGRIVAVPITAVNTRCFQPIMPSEFTPFLPGESSKLSDEAIQVRMMRELFTRTRESSLLGFLPVLLVAWAHWDAQPLNRLLYWSGGVLLVLVYRFAVAHTFLMQPQVQSARLRVWFVLEWFSAILMASAWVLSITLLGSGQVDTLFFLRLTCLVGLASFLLSALGIDLRLYASFMVITVGGTLVLLHRDFPHFVAEMPVVTTGLIVYGLMLLVRSRGEHRRAREWISARLAQRNLMEQLNRTILQEQATHETLRAQSLELEHTNRQLNQLAIRDGLTGAYRRGHIEGELRRLVKGMQRKPAEFSVLLMDIDLFKRVNDLHGHAVGDEVLRRLSALMQKTLRGSDLFGRWGGEEFVVLMPESGIAEAVEAADRVRAAVHSMEFEGDGSRFRVTVSIGVAQLEPAETAETLIQRVDKALYAAKHAGRDRVLAYETGQTLFSPLQ